MGALHTQKANKEYVCERGCVIKKGDTYHKIAHKFQKVRVRCVNHRPKPSELATSDKVSRLLSVGEMIEDTLSMFEKRECEVDSLISDLESGKEELESIAEEYEEGISNMPDNLQQSSRADEMQERADLIREWSDEFENVISTANELSDMSESNDEYAEKLEDLKSEIDSLLSQQP